MKYFRLISAVIMLALLSSANAFAESRVPVPKVPEAQRQAGPDGCVEPVDIMRKEHFKFIMHQRDETMHLGIRTTKHSLKECVTCHAVNNEQGQPVTVKDERHFCSSCHQYAAVHIDCFECHASTPEGGNTGAAPHKSVLKSDSVKPDSAEK